MKANYPICTGQLLTVTTKPDLFGGNAVKLTLGGLQVQLGFLRGLMRPEDYNDLEYYINEVSEANENVVTKMSNQIR